MQSTQTIKLIALMVAVLATSAFAYPTYKIICEMRNMSSTSCPMHAGQPMGPKDCCEISGQVPEQNPLAVDSPVRVEFHSQLVSIHTPEYLFTQAPSILPQKYLVGLPPPLTEFKNIILLI